MPKPNRHKPGQQFSSGNSGIDLGAILMGIYGGVEENPNLGQEVAKPKNFTGPMPTDNNLYKPRTIFDRAQAAQMNAERKGEQISADEEVTRHLRQETGMNDVLEQRGYGTNRVAVALADQMASANKSAAYTSILQQLGIPDSPETRALYEKIIQPKQFEATGQDLLTRAETSKTAGLDSALKGDIIKQTAPNQVAEALATSQFGRSVAEAQANSTLPDEMVRNKTRMLQGEPVWREGQNVAQRLMTLGQGQTVFDPLANPGKQTVFQSPVDPLKQAGINALNKSQGITAAPPTQPQQGMQDYTVDDLIIDPATKRILGVRRK